MAPLPADAIRYGKHSLNGKCLELTFLKFFRLGFWCYRAVCGVYACSTDYTS